MRFWNNARPTVEVFTSESFVRRYLYVGDDDINGPCFRTPIPFQFAHDKNSYSFICGGNNHNIILLH